MKRLLNILLCFGAAASLATASGQGFAVRHLGQGKSIVTFDRPSRYLVVPVEESAPETRILILDGGHTIQRINVRLAQQRVDYFVPIDLQAFRAEHLSLNTHMPVADALHRNASESVCWDRMYLSDDFDTANVERFRPAYHFTPLYGWMNDPNGMIYADGEYHLFYQYNPYGSMWGNMHWGHAVSKDLIRWEHLPVAIDPDDWGVVFSGCCVVDRENVAGFGPGAMLAFYTATSTFSHDGERQTQCIAWSTDGGRTFRKYERNPVLVSDRTDFRDPKIFRHEETGRWIMVLAVGQHMEFYSSENLLDWSYESSFGEGYGAHGGVWECPDLLRMPVEGSDAERWVLLCNINPGGPSGGSATQYFVGDFDGRTFIPEDDPETTKWLDWGKDHYAAVSWSDAPDGRRIALGWMSNWEYANDVPTLQFRGANTLPRELKLRAEGPGHLLCSEPVRETESLRTGAPLRIRPRRIANTYTRTLPDGEACEVELSLRNRSASRITIRLGSDAGDRLDLICDPAAHTLTMDRSACGDTDFNGLFATPAVMPVSFREGELSLRLFIDRASVELFVDGGRGAMTEVVYPTRPLQTLTLIAEGGSCTLESLVCHPLEKLVFPADGARRAEQAAGK